MVDSAVCSGLCALRDACVCHGVCVVVSSILRRLWYESYTSKIRVFAPAHRIIVFCMAYLCRLVQISQTFKLMDTFTIVLSEHFLG